MAPYLNHVVFHPPAPNYDPTCVPQRYKPCPAQLLEAQIGAAKPAGMSPNAVVVLVFFLTLGVWVACFFGFMWWIGRDIEKIRKVVEEENGMRLVRVAGAEGTDGKGKGSGLEQG